MKRLFFVVFLICMILTTTMFADAALPPWLRQEGERIVHTEGRDKNNPRYAYDARGARYALNRITADFLCDDFEEAKQTAANLIAEFKALPGVKDAYTLDLKADIGESLYTITVIVSEPYDSYFDIFSAIENEPEIIHVQKAFIDGVSSTVHLTYGDVDFNGAVTTTDARQILRYGVLLDTPEDYHVSIADFDRDGKISTEDARHSLRCAIGLDEKLPFEP